jgi:hypothetical protein
MVPGAAVVLLVCVAVSFNVASQEKSALAVTVPALPPLPPDHQLGLQQVRSDPHPEQLIRNVHYVASNERTLYWFKDTVADRGGIQIGVGAEQNYLLAAWSKPDLVICMDFDQYIVELHEVYIMLFKRVANADELIEWFSKAQVSKLNKLISEEYPDQKKRKALTRVVRNSGQEVHRHLTRSRQRFLKAGVATWLTDEAQFQTILDLAKADRIYPVRGDFTGSNTMQDLGAFARKFGYVVRVFYLSNAEYYFKYTDGSYRDNAAALPFDGRSIVLHTHPTKTDYRYYHHTGENYQEWAAHPKVAWFRTVKLHAVELDKPLFYEIRKSPEEAFKEQ